LLGHPVAHSLSPALHNAAFAALRIDANYEAWDVPRDGLDKAVAALRRVDCLGANVTAPHKEAVVAFMDEVSAEVNALGALNTIVNTDGRLLGENTDARGLLRWLGEAHIDPVGRACTVLGAGGAARATVWALANLGASSVLVLNRTPQRAQEVVTRLQPHAPQSKLAWGDLSRAAEPTATPSAVIVNATSPGHRGAAPSVHPSWYSPDSFAIELTYNPPETRFMTAARDAGARAENGLGMLLHQAALAFERWTGQVPPMHIYQNAMKQRVAS
jgi:shikimate dehydrogenase